MVFGIGSGLFFGHMPFLKVNGIPATSYRIFPGLIFKRLCKRLGIKMRAETFRSEKAGMEALDKVLAEGKPVGVLTSVYYLPYLPEKLRFHFNAHNLVVYGKEGNEYLVSDPVMEAPTRIDAADLARARFAKGALAPKGRMYYPIFVPGQVSLAGPVLAGIKKTARDMTTIPVPLFGVKGIRYLAKQVARYPEKVGDRRAALFLGNIVRMQEEIGTGGAGFRFIFAAFLQEASKVLNDNRLLDISNQITTIGDHWRDFAYRAARLCKDRAGAGETYPDIANQMKECADQEEAIFLTLRQMYK